MFFYQERVITEVTVALTGKHKMVLKERLSFTIEVNILILFDFFCKEFQSI